MAETIEGFGKALSSFLELKQVNIDNWWFKLFYKVTTVLLLLSTALVTVRQFFGEPIQCDAGSVSRKRISRFVCQVLMLRGLTG